MARGGARNRSGPKPNETSARSDVRGYSLEALPASGRKGRPPAFPLPDPTERELEAWREAWKTPQAVAWSIPSEVWRRPTVAMWVRVKVRCEDPDAPASLLGQLHRFADQIGMTTAGLAEMGWKIVPDAEMADTTPAQPPRESSRSRLRVVSGG